MNTDYRLLIDYDALLYIESLPKRDARAIRGRLVDISKYPDRFSDCQESDLKERLLDIHIFGKYAIRYWHDFNDRHVKILRVGLADRT